MITQGISNNAHHLDLQGKYNVSNGFDVTYLVSFLADKPYLRTNPFQEEGDDVIMDRQLEPEHEDELIADEKHAIEECLSQKEYTIIKDTLITVQATPNSS